MDKQELINVACRWLDYHNADNKYITVGTNRMFINGGLQTDMRDFLEKHKDDDYWETLDILRDDSKRIR